MITSIQSTPTPVTLAYTQKAEISLPSNQTSSITSSSEPASGSNFLSILSWPFRKFWELLQSLFCCTSKPKENAPSNEVNKSESKPVAKPQSQEIEKVNTILGDSGKHLLYLKQPIFKFLNDAGDCEWVLTSSMIQNKTDQRIIDRHLSNIKQLKAMVAMEEEIGLERINKAVQGTPRDLDNKLELPISRLGALFLTQPLNKSAILQQLASIELTIMEIEVEFEISLKRK